MQNLIRVINGLIILPLILVIVFSLVNAVLAHVFNGNYWNLQQSPIWILWVIMIVIIIVIYFSEYPLD